MADGALGHLRRFRLRDLDNLAQSGGMVGRLQVLDQGFPANGQTFFHNRRRLLTRQRVPLQGIARVSQLHLEPIPEVRHQLQRQRT
jgi:hypothetical protein